MNQNMHPVFITGIGTDVGKTLVAAILAEVWHADYWKPVQAGFAEGTDSEWVNAHIRNGQTTIYPETYLLKMAASPHIAAREEGKYIEIDKIRDQYTKIRKGLSGGRGEQVQRKLIIEGAGGLLVPLNDGQFVSDLILALDAEVILVSRNYLGSINHSLLAAAYCQNRGIRVKGWIFNDQYLDYASEIASWSGYPVLASIPPAGNVNQLFICREADRIRQLPAFRHSEP